MLDGEQGPKLSANVPEKGGEDLRPGVDGVGFGAWVGCIGAS